jgi:hypothetical protein
MMVPWLRRFSTPSTAKIASARAQCATSGTIAQRFSDGSTSRSRSLASRRSAVSFPKNRPYRSRSARIEKLDLPALKKAFDETWNPVVPLVDELRKKISKRSAGFVHWGATSKNIFDTGLMLQIRSSYDVVETHLWSLADRLAELAATHRDTVMAGRTHGQHALPVTLGFKAAV